MITYEFETPEFAAYEGDDRIKVRGGKLELENEPKGSLLALIIKHGGKRVDDEPRAVKRRAIPRTTEEVA